MAFRKEEPGISWEVSWTSALWRESKTFYTEANAERYARKMRKDGRRHVMVRRVDRWSPGG